MEAVGEHAPNQATRLGLFSNARFHQDPTAGLPEQPSLRAVPDPAESRRGLVPKQPAIPAVPTSDHAVSSRGVSDGAVSGAVATSLDLLGTARTTAAAELALSSFTDAADFAGQVEELSRTVEYLQVLAAAAVDRTRREAAVREAAGRLGAGVETSTGAGSTRGWVTGWGLETAHPGSAGPAGPGSVVSVGDAGTPPSSSAPGCGSAPPKHDDGWPWPQRSCRPPESPANQSRPPGKNSPPLSPPEPSPPAPRPSSPWPSNAPNTPQTPTPWHGWNTP